MNKKIFSLKSISSSWQKCDTSTKDIYKLQPPQKNRQQVNYKTYATPFVACKDMSNIYQVNCKDKLSFNYSLKKKQPRMII